MFALSGCASGTAAPEESVASEEAATELAPLSDSDALAYAEDFIVTQCLPGGLWESIGPLVVEGPMTGVNPFNSIPNAEYPYDDQFKTFDVYSNSKENKLFQILLYRSSSDGSMTFRGLFSAPDGISMDLWGCIPQGTGPQNAEIPYAP